LLWWACNSWPACLLEQLDHCVAVPAVCSGRTSGGLGVPEQVGECNAPRSLPEYGDLSSSSPAGAFSGWYGEQKFLMLSGCAIDERPTLLPSRNRSTIQTRAQSTVQILSSQCRSKIFDSSPMHHRRNNQLPRLQNPGKRGTHSRKTSDPRTRSTDGGTGSIRG
jgi:hypothetical protein